MNIELRETTHPDNKDARRRYDGLVGIDHLKEALLDELHLLLRPDSMTAWQKKHHNDVPDLVSHFAERIPVVLLSGEVGCGKSVLAATVGTPLAARLDARIKVLESPTDLRGGGHVGELSARVTEVFRKARISLGNTPGILVIDEADDIAASRAQDQAHHEDRAGVNVLIKQLDALASSKGLVVILITNRSAALDAAVVRRASLHLHFVRPSAHQREGLIRSVFPHVTAAHAKKIAAICETQGVPFSPSDITDRLFGSVVRQAWREDRPVDETLILEVAKSITATPLVETRT